MKKRKFRLPALAMAVVLSIGGVGTAGACNTYVHADEDVEIATGDVNSDNSINAEDALEALKYAAKLTDLDENARVRADVDCDKDVNAKDALYILQYAAHIIKSFDEIKVIQLDSAVYEAKYPEMELYANYEFDNAQYEKWNEDRSLQTKAYSSQYSGTLNNFFKTTIKGILEKDTNENVVFSPVNVYMAMAMIAETVDGEGRKEILDLIGVDSIDSLRKQANAVWNAHYCDDGTIVSLLGNSLWLRDDTTYKNSLLKTLSDNYYVSSYRGNMSSEEYNSDLRSWLNKHTGGMLKEQIKDVKFDTSTLMAMYSTIYFRGKWDEEFWEGSTKEDVFYSPSGEIKCDYLIDEGSWQDYYWADKFSAVNKEIVYGGKMWFILPDEGVSPQEVINEEEYLKLIFAEDEWENKRDDTKVNVKIPKFDITSNIELKNELKSLGVDDIFGEEADFSPIVDGESGISISSINHNARVSIDEEGCEATAFTEVVYIGSPFPPNDEVDFIADRPFIFVITSNVGTPLFVGIVNNP